MSSYVSARNVCEVACRAIGGGFYLGLGKTVADGTVCGESDDKICVSGECVVGSSLYLYIFFVCLLEFVLMGKQ